MRKFVRRFFEWMGLIRPVRKMTALLCYQCGRPAMMRYQQADGRLVPLCLEHGMMLHNMYAQRIRQNVQGINLLREMMDELAGHPRPPTAVQIPVGPIIHSGGLTLNHIQVSNSNIGVLNTGKIESIDTAIGYLSDTGGKAVADALKAMTEAVVASAEATTDQKSELLDLLGVLASEAATPREKRKSKAMLPIIAQVASVLSGLNALSSMWNKWAPEIGRFFGLS